MSEALQPPVPLTIVRAPGAVRLTREFFAARVTPEPVTIAAWLETLKAEDKSPANVKPCASTLRHWLAYLTERGALPSNPARKRNALRAMLRQQPPRSTTDSHGKWTAQKWNGCSFDYSE